MTVTPIRPSRTMSWSVRALIGIVGGSVVGLLALVAIPKLGLRGQAKHDILEPVHASARAIGAATEIGVTRRDLRELVHGFATQVAMARDQRLSDTDGIRLQTYAEVLQIYVDSLALWDWPTYEIPNGGGTLSRFRDDDANALRIVQKYECHVMPFAQGVKAVSTETLQKMWSAASTLLAKLVTTGSSRGW